MPEVIKQPEIVNGPQTVLESPPPVNHSTPVPARASSRYFLPLVDNGSGDGKMNWLVCLFRAFAGNPDVHIERFSDSLVPRARNRAAAAFLRGDRDYILFIDGDIIFDPHHITALNESDAPVLAGMYCKKSKEVDPCINLIPDNGNQAVGGLIEIARAGTGFLRIARHVLEAMKEPAAGAQDWRFAPLYVNHGVDEWDFFSVGVKNREFLSEDWYFCDRARALGFKIQLDSRIQTKHEGSAFYPTEEAIERQLAREREAASVCAAEMEKWRNPSPTNGDTPANSDLSGFLNPNSEIPPCLPPSTTV